MSTRMLMIFAPLALLGLVLLVSFKSNDIETPDYVVVKTIDEVEIRRYPKMIVAQTSLSSASYKDNSSNGFRTIANYIFGGNEANQKIAMTAPVVMNMGETPTMQFVMPRQYAKGELPKPNSKAVKIVEEAEKTLAVTRFGGYSNNHKIETHRRLLETILKKNGIATKGSFLYMGYNAPWDMVNRRNEVAIEVDMDAKIN